MFINRSSTGQNNICGEKIADYRKQLGLSQRALADRMQLQGLNIDKNAVQRIESGQRFVTDIEIQKFARFFDVTADELLSD